MQELKNVTASYSTEAVKMAIAQSTLNKTQIEAILSAKGLTGETLKTTTAELAQVTSTNALSASQTEATLTTNNLGLAMKGLGSKITAFLKTPAGFATIAVASIFAIKSAYDKYQEHLQEVIDKGKEASQSIKDSASELQSTKDTIDKATESYKKLADGVDLLTNKNISLSDEEYKEFIDLNNSLAEKFPELIKGVDLEGNKILNLGTNSEEATKKLNELYETQQKVFAQEAKEKLPDVFAGIYTEQKENLDDLFLERNTLDEGYLAREIDALFKYSEDLASLQSKIGEYGGLENLINSDFDLKDINFDMSFTQEATDQAMTELGAIQDIVESLTGKKIDITTEIDTETGLKNATLDLNSLTTDEFLKV